MKNIKYIKHKAGFSYFLYNDLKYRLSETNLTIQINNSLYTEYDRGTAGSFKCRFFFASKKLYHNTGFQNKSAREWNIKNMQKVPNIFFILKKK